MADKKLQSENTFPSLKELLEAGAHFGHSVKRRNPRMDEYVYATKNGVQIFDLVKTRVGKSLCLAPRGRPLK